ncbi:MAG: dihydrolipoyl dehydrogenase [Deltaproteobacteria bacterium]|jgi:dihydrolipoamide dehydrogenase|nr:dihydrolipoyl dehydrogenase [Deltaproteobacteria bacterium]
MAKKIIIIGGGPGGYVAAIRAAQLGADVTVIEKKDLGGTCLNRGCVPTKTMLHSARCYRSVLNSREFGVYNTLQSFRFDKMIKRKDEIVQTNVNGIKYLFQKNKIKSIQGTASLIDPSTVSVRCRDDKTERLKADAILLATGSEPLTPKFLKFDGDRVITTTEALQLDQVPKSIAIVGGSVSGCEFASLFSQLGAEVHIIEMLDRIVPTEDAEIASKLTNALEKSGINILTNSPVEAVERVYPSGDVKIAVKGHSSLQLGYCLLTLGRKLNTENIGLEHIGIKHTSAGIEVDDQMRTNIKTVYAVGDVTGKLLLAHVASEQGIIAVEHIMGKKVSMDYQSVPAFIYTHPEISSVGKQEVELKAEGTKYLTGKNYFKSNAMAMGMGMGEADGFVKVLADAKSHQILGIHLIGPHATDLLAEAVMIIKNRMTVEQVKDVIHPHPTLSEVIKEAVLATVGEAIHG